MAELLFWIYLINAVLLINHEIDSAYWEEWELFKLLGKITGFLLLHFVVLFVVLYGLVLVFQQRLSGYIISLIVGLAGLFRLAPTYISFERVGRNLTHQSHNNTRRNAHRLYHPHTRLRTHLGGVMGTTPL